jgi:hypothetical protein
MKKLYCYETSVGIFFICRKERVYFSLLGNEMVDSCSSSEEAARHLANGEHFALISGTDTATLEIPANLGEWEKID